MSIFSSKEWGGGGGVAFYRLLLKIHFICKNNWNV